MSLWTNNKCDKCGFKASYDLEKVSIEDEMSGEYGCPICTLGPDAPVGFRVTRQFILNKIHSSTFGNNPS